MLEAVASYADPVEGSRAEAVRRARREGRYERLPGLRIVTGYNARSRVLHVEGAEGPAPVPVPVPVDVVGPDERRLLFRRTAAGLEPLAVWLTPAGLPKKAHGWEDTFQARERPGRDGRRLGGGGPRRPLPAVVPPAHVAAQLRLKWFSILSAVWAHRVEGFTSEEVKDLRDQFGDIWYQLATLLGHRDPMTTREIYLEPFASLDVDYLMSLLTARRPAGVEALVRAVAAEGGRTLAAVGPPGRDGGPAAGGPR